MDKIILIGGAPTSGKTYTAKKLAEKFKLPWISTDTIRDQMQQIVRKEDYPMLFEHFDADGRMAEEYLNNNTAKQIVAHQNQESQDVWKGVKALITEDYTWGSFIVEGVAILPKLVKNLKVKDKKIIPIFLIDDNKARIRHTVYTRGLWDYADKYPDSVKDKEVEWVLEFNKYLLQEAKKYRCKVINVTDRRKVLGEVNKIVSKNK